MSGKPSLSARRRTPLLALALDRASGATLQQQLYDQVREVILSGGLAPGVRLPSSRALASELGCSRNTVVSTFDQLLSEGYLEGHAGSGTFVCRVLPEDLLGLPPGEAGAKDVPASRAVRGSLVEVFHRVSSRRRHRTMYVGC